MAEEKKERGYLEITKSFIPTFVSQLAGKLAKEHVEELAKLGSRMGSINGTTTGKEQEEVMSLLARSGAVPLLLRAWDRTVGLCIDDATEYSRLLDGLHFTAQITVSEDRAKTLRELYTRDRRYPLVRILEIIQIGKVPNGKA